jgi:hypothetical protein
MYQEWQEAKDYKHDDEEETEPESYIPWLR